MMKKFLAMLLTLCLILALAACAPTAVKPQEAEQEEPQATGEFLPDETLQGAVSEAQPGDEPEEMPDAPETPAEQEESAWGGIVDTTDSFWYESDSGSGSYTDEVGNEMTYSYAVPAFNLDSPDASDMNEAIEAACSPVIAEMKDAEANKYSLMYNSISYEAYRNGDIVSILLVMNTDIEVVEYAVYNLNVVTGERASGAEMIRYAGMTEDAFLEAAQTATEGKFMELYDGLQDDVEYFEEQLAKTMSADVFSLSAPMYLNGEGRVCIIARIYALAGASYYDHVLELG